MFLSGRPTLVPSVDQARRVRIREPGADHDVLIHPVRRMEFVPRTCPRPRLHALSDTWRTGSGG